MLENTRRAAIRNVIPPKSAPQCPLTAVVSRCSTSRSFERTGFPPERCGVDGPRRRRATTASFTSIGWVPVDVTGAMTSKNTDKDDFFGRDEGDFITMHVDTDLNFNSIHFGKKDLGWRQGAAFWVKGAGTLDGHTFTETWTVNPGGAQPD